MFHTASTARREAAVVADGVELPALLAVPRRAVGAVVFAHGSGSSRLSPRNTRVAELLEHAHLATLLVDLLTSEEAADRHNVFDIPLLGRRLAAATGWLRLDAEAGILPVGYFGASTGAAAALWAAAEDPLVWAVVSRGGRPDLAGPALGRVRAPTLLIVGGYDPAVLDVNEEARLRMHCTCELRLVPGATHLFEQPGTLERVAHLARDWFLEHLER